MMLKVSFRVNGNTTVHAEGQNTAEVFEKLAMLCETFGEPDAVKGSERGDYVYRVREVDGNKFHELYSSSLNAKLPFGQNKETKHVYPKRMETDSKGKAIRDDNGKAKYLPDRGWLRWNPDTQKEE